MNNPTKTSLSLIVFLLFFVFTMQAQSSMAHFEIQFHLDKNRIAMDSNQGNNWNSLYVKSNSFNLNQDGMLSTEHYKEEYKNSNYIIAISRKGKKITLEGKKGVNFKEVAFEIPEKGSFIVINVNGIKNDGK